MLPRRAREILRSMIEPSTNSALGDTPDTFIQFFFYVLEVDMVLYETNLGHKFSFFVPAHVTLLTPAKGVGSGRLLLPLFTIMCRVESEA